MFSSASAAVINIEQYNNPTKKGVSAAPSVPSAPTAEPPAPTTSPTSPQGMGTSTPNPSAMSDKDRKNVEALAGEIAEMLKKGANPKDIAAKSERLKKLAAKATNHSSETGYGSGSLPSSTPPRQAGTQTAGIGGH